MADVADRIRTEEDSATAVSDDLLQCEQGYGGLREDGLFDFVFFPRDQVTWAFRLTADEIDEIANGERAELQVGVGGAKYDDDDVDGDAPTHPWDLSGLTLPEGLAKLESVGVHGISEHSSRDDVIAALGPPAARGGDAPARGRRHPEPWVKYRMPECRVHFSFFRSGKLRRITFMPRD